MIVITAHGRLAHQPELKMLPGGGSVCEFRLLSSRFAKGEEVTEAVTFFCFDEEAEKFCESTEKGQLISATGTQETSSYNDAQGARKSFTKYRMNWYNKGARPRSSQQGSQQGDNTGGQRPGGDRQGGGYQANRNQSNQRPSNGGYSRAASPQSNQPEQRPQRPAQAPSQAQADYGDSGFDSNLDGFDDVSTFMI